MAKESVQPGNHIFYEPSVVASDIGNSWFLPIASGGEYISRFPISRLSVRSIRFSRSVSAQQEEISDTYIGNTQAHRIHPNLGTKVFPSSHFDEVPSQMLSSDEIDRRYSGLDVADIRRRLSAEDFKVFMDTVGSVEVPLSWSLRGKPIVVDDDFTDD